MQPIAHRFGSLNGGVRIQCIVFEGEESHLQRHALRSMILLFLYHGAEFQIAIRSFFVVVSLLAM